jgi:lysophospholipase L1-like esterase
LKRSKVAVAIACTVLAASCVPAVTTQSTRTSGTGADQLRFLALGDSYTIGEGVAAQDRWPVQLAALLRSHGIAIGDPEIIARTGWTTDELQSAIGRESPHGPYALVTLLIGVNNQYRGRSITEYRAQFTDLLTQAIALAGGQSTRVLVLSIPDWGVTPFAAGKDQAQIAGDIDRFNAVNREVTVGRGARYVDITPDSRTATDAGSFAVDGLHPSGMAYRRWAEDAVSEAQAALGGAGTR